MSASLIPISVEAPSPDAWCRSEAKQHYIVSDIITAILMRADLATTSRERSQCRKDLLSIEQMAAEAGDTVGEMQELKG